MRRLLAALAALCVPALALAQEAVSAADVPIEAITDAAAPIAAPADMALTLFAALGSVITALLGWLSVHASKWLKAKAGNEAIGGAIARFTDSVFTAVKLVNQTLKKEIEAAKNPNSPGGAAITKDEAAKLKDAAWAALKAEYGGMSGITKALGVLGLGEGNVAAWVDSKIEAAVHDVNASVPTKPAAR